MNDSYIEASNNGITVDATIMVDDIAIREEEKKVVDYDMPLIALEMLW